MNLIIVESPTKARTLSRFLGTDYSVLATTGHIKDLPKSKLSIDVEHNFKPDYQVVDKRKDTIKALVDSAQKAKGIYIATDPDREGEAIAQHVADVLLSGKTAVKKDQLKRISFHEITKTAVEEAMTHPGVVNTNLVNAQTARRVLDRLVGYKISPLLWKKIRRGLSAGRVQSVAVRLIVERENEIEKFKTEEYWEIFVEVKNRNGENDNRSFIVNLLKIDGKTASIGNKEEAAKAVTDLKKSGYKVSDVRRREVRKSPYPPFTTSTMTQAAARVYGWSAKKTMNVAQKLYEEGLITYHRTDSFNLATAAVDAVRKYIISSFGNEYVPEKPRLYKTTSKVVQEAHEAIRPTDVSVDPQKMQFSDGKFLTEGKILYDLVWKRFVACQMSPTVFDETKVDVTATPDANKTEYLLRASGQIMKFDGWRKVIPLRKDEEPELPMVAKDDTLDMKKVTSEQKFTSPPPRFNEASLIKTLEKLGIGRPSTYAPIISTIQARAYVEKDEGKFKPTSIGVAVNEFLVTNFADIMEYSFTADMEGKLDDIANGDLEWPKMMANFYTPFDKKVVVVDKEAKRVKIEAEKLGKKCPTCDKEGRSGEKQGELVVRTGRFGKFISCSLFPECKHTEKYILKVGVKCPECKTGDVIIKTTKRGKKFYGCSRYPKCKYASWKNPKAKDEKEK